MSKISDFSKSERIITVVSAIWVVIIFVVAMENSNGDFDQNFIGFFLIFGLLPVLAVIGWKWIQGASAKK